jgi:hypothetical protein
MKTIYLLLIALLVTTCNSDDPVDPASLLPPITMTGENTFGCLIDGKFFRPRDGSGTFSNRDIGLNIRATETANFEIDIRDYKSFRTSRLLIHLEDLFELDEGLYQINESNGQRGIDGNDNTYMHCSIWNERVQSYESYVSFENSGIVEVTKRQFIPQTSHIYSGTFRSKLVNISNVNDTILIELGRFDIDAFTFESHIYD